MAMSVPDPYSAPHDGIAGPLWTGGPSPGAFYQFPTPSKSATTQPITHTL